MRARGRELWGDVCQSERLNKNKKTGGVFVTVEPEQKAGQGSDDNGTVGTRSGGGR